ncbi:MAG: PadR family transcriptional regulator PadR [Francisellaceae bacterium]|jgi:DNA-binding PadR family transcriptional regulator
MANKQSYLGEFEYFVLLCILQLKGEAYGVTIRAQFKKTIDRDVSLGAIYSTFERLEKKGLIQSRKSEALPERGGKPKRLVKVTSIGKEELLATKKRTDIMWKNVNCNAIYNFQVKA